MTKVSDTVPKVSPSVKPRKTRQAKTAISDKDKWDPNKPFHVTQEELWERIHEIEKGAFFPVEEVHQRARAWMDNYRPKE